MKYVLLVMIIVTCLMILGPDFINLSEDFNLSELNEASKVEKVESIAQDYYRTHTYIDDDIFDCDNMAQDVWNILRTEGINSKIVVGNVNETGNLTIENCDHVWLLAEVSPNEWIAVETTNGEVVYKEDNENYYEGFLFSNPKNYREFIKLYGDYNYQLADCENEKEYYNYLVDIYNDGDYYERLQLKSALDITKNNLEIKEKRALDTWTEIENLLEQG